MTKKSSACAVHVGTMLYGRHDDGAVVVVDLVQHAVGTAPGRPGSGVRRQKQALAESLRVLQQRGRDELVHRSGYLLRETAGKGARGRTGDQQMVGAFGWALAQPALRVRFAMSAASSPASSTSPASIALLDSAN